MTSFLIRRKRCRFFAAVLVIKMDIKCRNETARTYEKKNKKYEKIRETHSNVLITVPKRICDLIFPIN